MSALPQLLDCKALAAELGVETEDQRLTAAEWAAMLRDPTKDKRYLTASRTGGDLAEYLVWGATEGGKAPATLDQYERDIARGLLMFPHLNRDGWAKQHIREVLAVFPPGSRARAWSAWSSFWHWQFDEERVAANPMRGIRRPRKPERKIPRVFNDGERAALVTRQNQSLLPSVDRARQLFLHDTGARAGEARAFRLEHADLASRYVILYGTKGRGGEPKERRVPIRGELVQTLTDLMTFPLPKIDRPLGLTDFLFFPSGASTNGGYRLTWLDPTRPMGYSTFHRWWDRCVERSGIAYRNPHTTRHTYATDLVDASDDILAARDVLGHESVKTTEFYLRVSQKRVESAVEKLAQIRAQTAEAGETSC